MGRGREDMLLGESFDDVLIATAEGCSMMVELVKGCLGGVLVFEDLSPLIEALLSISFGGFVVLVFAGTSFRRPLALPAEEVAAAASGGAAVRGGAGGGRRKGEITDSLGLQKGSQDERSRQSVFISFFATSTFFSLRGVGL